MTKRFSFAPLYFLALCGMAGSLVGQSILLGETKLGKTVRPEPISFHDVVKNVLPAVVTIVTSMPRTLSTLSYTISGKMICSRRPRL